MRRTCALHNCSATTAKAAKNNVFIASFGDSSLCSRNMYILIPACSCSAIMNVPSNAILLLCLKQLYSAHARISENCGEEMSSLKWALCLR